MGEQTPHVTQSQDDLMVCVISPPTDQSVHQKMVSSLLEDPSKLCVQTVISNNSVYLCRTEYCRNSHVIYRLCKIKKIKIK